MSCGCPSIGAPTNPAGCASANWCPPPDFGLAFPSLVGPQGPPGGQGTYVPSYALLRLLDPTVFSPGYLAQVGGRTGANDGGGGVFSYNPLSAAADNGGTIIAPGGGQPGRWERVITGAWNILWFAPVNDTALIQAGLTAAAGKSIFFPGSAYTLNNHLNVPANTIAFGAGIGATVITQTTADKSVFRVVSVSNSALESMTLIGGPTTVATPVVYLGAETGDNTYTRLIDIEIASMANLGIGVHLRAATGFNMAFTYLRGVVVSGGPAAGWATKVGIQIGTSGAGNINVVRTVVIGGRILRTATGMAMDRCDTVMSYGLGMDDISGTGLDFTGAGGCMFFGFAPEPGTFGKLINFGAAAADNFVDGYLSNVPLADITDAGSNNGWNGTDGSGSALNTFPNPRRFKGIVSFSSIFGYAAGTGGTVTQITSKSTNVTLNKLNGVVTMTADNLANGAAVGFNILNSTVGADDMVVVCRTAGTSAAYLFDAKPNGAGAIAVNIRNISGGDLAEAVGIKFMVLRSVVA